MTRITVDGRTHFSISRAWDPDYVASRLDMLTWDDDALVLSGAVWSWQPIVSDGVMGKSSNLSKTFKAAIDQDDAS